MFQSQTTKEKKWKAKPGFHSMNKYFWEADKILNNVIFSNMDGPTDCHIEWSKSEKGKYMILLICGT